MSTSHDWQSDSVQISQDAGSFIVSILTGSGTWSGQQHNCGTRAARDNHDYSAGARGRKLKPVSCVCAKHERSIRLYAACQCRNHCPWVHAAAWPACSAHGNPLFNCRSLQQQQNQDGDMLTAFSNCNDTLRSTFDTLQRMWLR